MTSSKNIMKLLNNIPDPEIPAISIVELGMVKKAIFTDDGSVEVTITPTYSGCPAVDPIKKAITKQLKAEGFRQVTIKEQLYPVWTTDAMDDSTKAKLKRYGIAPPENRVNTAKQYDYSGISCPRCNSKDTGLVSMFGSTPCKALLKCNTCLEPFEHFKCH